MTAPLDLIGKKFGKLLVLERHYKNSKANKTRFKCNCDCGNTIVVVGSSLVNGHATSCGCYRNANNKVNKLSPPGQVSYLIKYGSCKKAAFSRDLGFSLTKEQHKDLILQNCYYCGDPPIKYNPYITLNKVGRKYPILQETIDRAWIVANGIDRVNNAIGYTIENCVPCCHPCNEAKSDRSAEEYLKRCCRVAELHRGNKYDIS